MGHEKGTPSQCQITAPALALLGFYLGEGWVAWTGLGQPTAPQKLMNQ